MAKLAHKAVQYGPGHPRGDHCAVCRHFEATQHCDIVADPIQPLGWCNRFAKRKHIVAKPKYPKVARDYVS
jgi:hypothetical protein